ncbi:PREDICTED: transcription factor bHLH30-like [Nelumbo nucifera]|uniref:Transcription factor bHLH30-like n=2 Tax=Nelumbo nucifera TaxID=4432 RepID=A0A822XXH5_NELNU|nr:PREDICTED: transcription factor bHLH30-like [Nelumbo nucifera]DAD22098.1 TPA_asm: hypothetical protein HUJ06_023561 [Nelumbo nucifera]
MTMPFPSYYEWEDNSSNRNCFLWSLEMMNDGRPTSGSRITAEAKAVAACKSHSEAERRRRERINGHLATLRTLLPNTTKTDKATLLAEVVRHVKELKKLAANLAAQDGEGCNGSSREWAFPGETDELTLGYCDEESKTIKASLCCDDRPDLLSDLTKVLKSAGGRVVKAEMATLGGRTKGVFVIERRNGGGSGDNEDLEMLRRALKSVFDKPVLPAWGEILPGNKRPRLFRPTHYQ